MDMLLAFVVLVAISLWTGYRLGYEAGEKYGRQDQETYLMALYGWCDHLGVPVKHRRVREDTPSSDRGAAYPAEREEGDHRGQ